MNGPNVSTATPKLRLLVLKAPKWSFVLADRLFPSLFFVFYLRKEAAFNALDGGKNIG
jgi:hypothetical protein